MSETPTPSPRPTPQATEADREFLAYQATGAPRHMARVFDLVAGELLLLASHLARDPHTAEDLVQTTFLEAIKHAGRFEPRSGVKQWLVGILANQARLEWRRRRRKLDPERVRSEAAVDPDFEVEAREFTSALKQAMAGLPPKYREVLRLSLFHHLSSTEIARAVDRPRETVKSQVRRGMQMLQRAMPQSLALGALVTVMPGRGLAAMRLAVLARAEAVQAAAATAAATAAARAVSTGADPVAGFGSWAGWGGTARQIAAVAAVGILAVGAWQLWPDAEDLGERNAAGSGGPTVHAPGVGGQDEAVSDRRMPLGAAGTGSGRGRGTGNATGELLVRARFQSDREPVAGAAVSVRPEGETTWLRDRVARADHVGSARFPDLPPGKVQVFGGRGGKAEARVLAGRKSRVELAIPPGIHLSGVVKGRDDRPLAGVAICLAPPRHGLDFGVEVARSDAAGRFSIRDVQPLRGMAAYAPGRVGPRPLVLRGRPGRRNLVLQFRGAAAAIRGVVRGPDGKPAAGAAVMVGWSFDPGLGEDLACYPLRTDGRGAFLAPGVMTGHDLPVWVKGTSPATAVWRGTVSSMDAGGETFLEVDLKRGARVHGVVRRYGEAVAGVLVEALQDDVEEGPGFKFGGPAWARVETRSDGDGSFVLENIHPGGGKLAAADPERGELGQARRAFHLADGEELEWNAVLGKGLAILGRVVDERGAPIPDFRVKLQGPKHTEDRVCYSGADGGFVFGGLEDIAYLLTMAEKDPVIPNLAVFFENVRPGPEVVDFPIADGARATCTFTGTLVGPGTLPVEGLRISLVHEQDGTRKGVEVSGFEYRQGRFRFGPVPPAVYHLFGASKALGMIYLGRFEAGPGQSVDVGTARFREPGSLSVRVKDPDGRPTAIGFLGIRAEGSPAGTRVALKGGCSGEQRLPPGTYWLTHWSYRHAPCLRRVEVASGRHVKLDIQLQGGVEVGFRLPPVPAVGTALETELYRVEGKAGVGIEHLAYREQRIYGHVTKPVASTLALAPGRYRLVVRDLAGRQAETRFSVRPGGQRQQVDVRFPGGR